MIFVPADLFPTPVKLDWIYIYIYIYIYRSKLPIVFQIQLNATYSISFLYILEQYLIGCFRNYGKGYWPKSMGNVRHAAECMYRCRKAGFAYAGVFVS